MVGVSALVGAVLAGSSRSSGPPPDPAPRPAPSASERVLTGPLLNRTGAWLTVSDAASRVRVQTATLPGLLYRVSSAPGSGVAPVVVRRGGRVAVHLRATEGNGIDEVRIVLNRDVRWDIRLPAGAGEQQLDLCDGRVSRVDLGASGLAEVSLPDPDGTVSVTFTGGVGTAILATRTGAPFRIHLDQGAGAVLTPWVMNNGTPTGAVFQEAGWPLAADRYVVRAVAGMGSVVLRRSGPARPRTH
ncbi:hypothetical protein Areg01_77000 [Actinoplanes regularis]|nr:hypothetical protein Areg01_77000 [Actinoplanes regularis]